MRRQAAALMLAATMVAGASRGARAAPPSPPTGPTLLRLDLKRCPSLAENDVRSMVGIELRRTVVVALVEDGSTATAAATSAATARVTCIGLHAEIDIDDPLTDKAVTRVIDLQATAMVARPRLLALAIVELLSASWLELESAPRSGAPQPGAMAPPETRAEALLFLRDRSSEQRSARLMAAFVATSIGVGRSAPGLRLWGAGLVVGGDVVHHVAWMTDLSIAHGSRAFSLGRVTAETVGGLVGLLGHLSRSTATLRGGIGVRGGGAWLSGMPLDPEVAFGGAVRGFWWGPAVLLDATVAIGRRVVVGATIEAGRLILPVTGRVQGDDPVVIDGTWLRGGLGVGLVL